MTATNVVIDNIIDYSTQLTNISNELGDLNTNIKELTSYLSAFVTGQYYFSKYPRSEYDTFIATWTNVTSTIHVFLPTEASRLILGSRVEGINIDYNTTVTSITTSSTGTYTIIDSIILSKPTLGGVFVRVPIRLFET